MTDTFDKHAKDYSQVIGQSLSISGKDHDFFVRHKAQQILGVISAHMDPAKAQVLDVGCGVGLVHPHLHGLVGQLQGVDVSQDSIVEAQKANPDIDYQSYDGSRLPYDDDSFDVTFAVCVMHHVPPSQWPAFSKELKRVLKPGGTAIIIEHNPINPMTQYIVRTCELDDDAVLLRAGTCAKILKGAGFTAEKTDYVLFTPFESGFFRSLDHAFKWLPLGAQYVLQARA